MNLWGKLALLLLSALLVAVTSASHVALAMVNRGRLRHLAAEGVAYARSLLALAEDANHVEPSLAAANATALVLAGGVGAVVLAEQLAQFPVAMYAAGAIGLLVALWLQLILRAIGSSRPEGTLRFLLWPTRLLSWLFRPLVVLIETLARPVMLREAHLRPGFVCTTDEELRMIVGAVEEEGALEEEERDMIQGIFELGERTAREIMIPRVDMVAVDADAPLRQVLERIKARGHSRVPIYEETIDNIVGIVYAKDLLRHMEDGSLDEPARTLARSPHFIPESKKVDELLHEMQQDKVHMAIVLDEYGGTAGLVTIEDLLEEIVGEIQDEYDYEEKAVEKLSDQEAIFDARVSIHDVNEILGVSLANGEYDTVGGLVYDRLGKIPVVGDELHLDALSLTVLSTVGKRIKKVRIRVEPTAESEERRDGRE